ncbi:hypothetical protein [Streptosporangium sp. NPDC051022]|uniref:hypothetical protein n=1 Tax=Streptosporangium sp. NPDC051022 TaxID=3155752 RepID=UPI003434E8A6
MNPAIVARIPLVCRPKPPGTPLATRIAELTALSLEPADAGHRQSVARVSGALNFAALIASDVGLPDLAAIRAEADTVKPAGKETATRESVGLLPVSLLPE